MTSLVSFARRRNPDSTIDSICTKCYQTIACGQSDSSLASAEENHLCDLNAELDRRKEISRYTIATGRKSFSAVRERPLCGESTLFALTIRRA
jgi:hypothetical protein